MNTIKKDDMVLYCIPVPISKETVMVEAGAAGTPGTAAGTGTGTAAGTPGTAAGIGTAAGTGAAAVFFLAGKGFCLLAGV